MRIVVTDFGKFAYRDITSYIEEHFGLARMLQFEQEVKKTGELLLTFPNAGKEEPLLAHRPLKMRSIPIGPLTKMIYHVDGDVITVVDFWPTRRDPGLLAQSV
ncbi:MAG: type II toxin-antitoxin system RelE/ParE family toxin [Paludibacteraceae bacterium]|nr:type II toxin-antitoxin system RelE/ParE family toxin [Paludibacteraceae bacterium]